MGDNAERKMRCCACAGVGGATERLFATERYPPLPVATSSERFALIQEIAEEFPSRWRDVHWHLTSRERWLSFEVLVCVWGGGGEGGGGVINHRGLVLMHLHGTYTPTHFCNAIDGAGGGHAAGHAREASRLRKQRDAVVVEGYDGKRVAGADEEAVGAEDHVAVAVAVAGSTLQRRGRRGRGGRGGVGRICAMGRGALPSREKGRRSSRPREHERTCVVTV
jgi:hypothetical protein